MKTLALSDSDRALLDQFGFRRVPFARLVAELRAVERPEDMHMIREVTTIPDAGEIASLPAKGTAAHDELVALGRDEITAGRLAAVVLCGGMATRFGASVKALEPLHPDRALTFLGAKRLDVGEARAVPLVLMTSFATDAAIRAHADGAGLAYAPQFVSLRVTRAGEIFRDDDGNVSPHATGHGDLPAALQASGVLDALRARGVRTVLVSNVDNIGATADPAVLGWHRSQGGKISVELVEKKPGDHGGVPVRLGGRLVLAEAFRLPSSVPHESFPFFNTNTLWIDLDVFDADADADWTWCVATKRVDGREALQFERLLGELTWWHETRYLHVPRDGAVSRFIPVKDVEEWQRSLPAIDAVVRTRLAMGGS